MLNREKQVTGIYIKLQGFPRIRLALSNVKCQNHYAIDRSVNLFFCNI